MAVEERVFFRLSPCGCFYTMFPLGLLLILPVHKSRSSTLKGEGRLPKVMQEIVDSVRQKYSPTALNPGFQL